MLPVKGRRRMINLAGSQSGVSQSHGTADHSAYDAFLKVMRTSPERPSGYTLEAVLQ